MKRTRNFSSWLSVLLSLFLAAGSTFPVFAGRERIRFDHLTVAEGLSQNTVNAILQDHLGYLWFGTEAGLNRYDGYQIHVYQQIIDGSQTVALTAIRTIFEDSREQIWIGTTTGLLRFDRSTSGLSRVNDDSAQTLGQVNAITETPDGRLLIGTQVDGLWIFDPDANSLTNLRHNPTDQRSLANNSIYAIATGAQIWLGTDAGLERFDLQQGTFEHFNHKITQPNSLTNDHIRTLCLDRSGALWIGTEGGGLNRLDLENQVFSFYLASPVDSNSLSDNRIQAILEDRQGMFWLAIPQGLDRLDPTSGEFTHFRHDPKDPTSLGGSQIRSLYEDRSGLIWIGTLGAGLSIFKPAAHKFGLIQASPLSPGGLSSNAVTAILETRDGNLWIGTGEAGLNRLDRYSGEWTNFRNDPFSPESLSSDLVTSLAEDKSGQLWIGTSGGGLNLLDPGTGNFKTYRYQFNDPGSLSSNTVQTLLIDQNETLWVGTIDAGLNRLDPGEETFTQYRRQPGEASSLSSDSITTLFEDRSGVLWVGTFDRGLNRFDPQTETFQHFRHDPAEPNSLSSDQIYALAELPQGVLWVGTRAGLNRLDLSNRAIQRYGLQQGLPAELIAALQADDQGSLWISTVQGLSRMDPEKGTFSNYSIADGLQSTEFNMGASYRSSHGELFFGGVQGLNAFFPKDIQPTSAPPALVVTAFQIRNQTVARDLTGEDGEPLQLSYRDDWISFEFAALDFNAPAGNRFRYKMEGFDPEWIEAGTRNFASYTNLSGGHYTFILLAANSEGVWNETSLSIPLVVKPPFWQTVWFQGLAILVIVSLAYVLYRWRLHSIQQYNRRLEDQVAVLSHQVEAQAVAEERNRLARDLHDSVTQSLYSLTLLSEAGQRTLERGDNLDSRKTMARLGEIAQQSLQEMRLMLYELRSPLLEETGLAGAIEHRLESVERRAGINARLTIKGEIELTATQEQDLYQLVQEALNNALKHSGGDVVTVRITSSHGSIRLEVQDNGQGFDPQLAGLRGGLGLASMHERAKRLGGELLIDSQPGAGTRILFSQEVQDGR